MVFSFRPFALLLLLCHLVTNPLLPFLSIFTRAMLPLRSITVLRWRSSTCSCFLPGTFVLLSRGLTTLTEDARRRGNSSAFALASGQLPSSTFAEGLLLRIRWRGNARVWATAHGFPQLRYDEAGGDGDGLGSPAGRAVVHGLLPVVLRAACPRSRCRGQKLAVGSW
ncbi:hypothetical protein GGX14DRAFT_403236 [Mycena pura]|uniref:Uncharacterized protein n=1 Tax=Mycena pura TaxID=153505 RepID=A0AAD6UX07_9AGAR|nr:hypothetical protein GGX14DRAFT_403236 [Mycena pura]